MKVNPKGQFGEHESVKELKGKIETLWNIHELTQTSRGIFTYRSCIL